MVGDRYDHRLPKIRNLRQSRSIDNLDLTSIKIDQLISEITDEFKITTVVITHDMNSMMEIGEKIMFLYQGKKLWEGNSDTLIHSDVNELNEFINANKLIREMEK